MLKRLGSLSVGCAIAFYFASAPAFAGAEEDNAIAMFEAYCLENLSNPNRAKDMAGLANLVVIPERYRTQLLGDIPGTAWFSNAPNARQLIKLTDEGACAVHAPFANGKMVLDLFEKNSRSRLLKTEQDGSQLKSFYAVTVSDQRAKSDQHAIVVIDRSNLTSLEGVALHSLPEALALKGGISPQRYP